MPTQGFTHLFKWMPASSLQPAYTTYPGCKAGGIHPAGMPALFSCCSAPSAVLLHSCLHNLYFATATTAACLYTRHRHDGGHTGVCGDDALVEMYPGPTACPCLQALSPSSPKGLKSRALTNLVDLLRAEEEGLVRRQRQVRGGEGGS